MARIDYGQVPSISPDLSNSQIVRMRHNKDNYTHLKYIDNLYINSPNRGYPGFTLVGKSKSTGKWGIIRVWRYCLDAS